MIEQDPRVTEGSSFFRSLYDWMRRVAISVNGTEKQVATNTASIATNTAEISANTAAIATKVSKTGDTMTTSGSTATLTISDTGGNGANLKLAGNGGTTPNKSIRAQSGNLEFVNSAYSVAIAALSDGGRLSTNFGYGCKAGTSGGTGANTFNLFWTGAAMQLWVDTTNTGTINVTSDERIKHEISPIASDRAAFMRIVPISYQWKTQGIYVDDGVARWGFSAQNLFSTIPKAVTGDVTAVDEDGKPIPAQVDDRPILAMTVLEVQALIREVEALRAQVDALKTAP